MNSTSERSDVVIYSLGLVMSSVCAPASMDRTSVENAVNRQHPTGISSEWTVSNELFTGTEQRSPAPCNHDPGRRHWLLSC